MSKNIVSVPKEAVSIASGNFETSEIIAKRASIRLNSPGKEYNSKREDLNGPVIWFDTAKLSAQRPDDSIFIRVINSLYSGIVLYPDNISTFINAIPKRMQIVLKVRTHEELNKFKESEHFALFKPSNTNSNKCICSNDIATLKKLKAESIATCYESYVDDQDSLLKTINEGMEFNFLWILFRDPTNIPLELVIASLQSTGTILLKEISNPDDVDDAIVSYGVMEYGAEGVIFSPNKHDVMSDFIDRLSYNKKESLQLQVGIITESRPVGMGYRACIDTSTLFSENEGMLVGSTSQGALLCCPEVFFLPYMELRPFRINAGAIHAYVYNFNNRTDYMSELKAGSSVMAVNSKGEVRHITVGRVKIEQRPLRLIEAEFPGNKRVNVLMQDDWHVRIFSSEAKPLNISELKPGDKVLGYITEPGRHVGIKINESIIEK
ncbi:3-dehydroquinate synthase II [Photorhabdus sp. APURE]|uniref:3-dehydroquinate synthase II n=1 Tax=Photorhabdus aballayi TaxID=2991723 RepID=UPI00223C9721|nr:3-dehydroquinate synthase II [Photorhabdus aballayi]MCW7548146.1 3-dehydroquinate synthase II [Photorhabdus aballayi]